MNNLDIINRVNSRSENKLANFGSLLNIYPEIVSDSEAVDMINSMLFPIGYSINRNFIKDSIKYYSCGSSNSYGGGHSACGSSNDRGGGHSACGSSNDRNHGGGHPCGHGGNYTGHSVCGQSCKPEEEMVKRLMPIIPVSSYRSGKNAIKH